MTKVNYILGGFCRPQPVNRVTQLLRQYTVWWKVSRKSSGLKFILIQSFNPEQNYNKTGNLNKRKWRFIHFDPI